MQRSISGSDFSSGFRLIRNDIFFDFLDNPTKGGPASVQKQVAFEIPGAFDLGF